MLVLQSISKEYDMLPVLDGVSITLEPGVWYSLSAPNGAGKTTLLRIMSGLTRPTRGQVMWKSRTLDAEARREFGVVMDRPMLYADLTGKENLSLYASLYGCESARETVTSWLDTCGLTHAAETRVRDYSKGMKQRLALARAFLHGPKLLLLDEPFDGLDREFAKRFSELLRDMVRGGASAMVVTHHAEEDEMADVRLTLRWGHLVKG